jgi:hypothetical protein
MRHIRRSRNLPLNQTYVLHFPTARAGHLDFSVREPKPISRMEVNSCITLVWVADKDINHL